MEKLQKYYLEISFVENKNNIKNQFIQTSSSEWSSNGDDKWLNRVLTYWIVSSICEFSEKHNIHIINKLNEYINVIQQYDTNMSENTKSYSKLKKFLYFLNINDGKTEFIIKIYTDDNKNNLLEKILN